MSGKRVLVPLVVAVVAVTAVAFGPLVAGVSLASEPDVEFGAEGSLTVASVQFPASATIEPAGYGAGNAYLTVPDTTLAFESLSGQPTLVYTLRIEGLGLQRSTAHFLDSSYGPSYEATMSTYTIETDELDQRSYDATLSIAVRNGTTQRTAARRNITVEVTE